MSTAPVGADLVAAASRLAERLLGGTGPRWVHTGAVAARAAAARAAVAPDERPVLVAAAWLHDVGDARALVRSSFHPVDGAWHLQGEHWPELVSGLVAHHSGARFVAAVRGLGPLMRPFADPRTATGPLADALTYADQTTAPDGRVVDVEERLTEMLARHGPDSPNARCHALRAPVLRAAVRATEQRLHAAVRAPDDAPRPSRSLTWRAGPHGTGTLG